MTDTTSPSRFAFSETTAARLADHLRVLYGDEFDAVTFIRSLESLVTDSSTTASLDRLTNALPPEESAIVRRDADSFGLPRAGQNASWSERDIVLITYGDQFQDTTQSRPPLRVLRDFLRDTMGGVFSDVHLLPCFPYTSDDGFSVSDFETIDPALGTWSDVAMIAADTQVAFDLVLNHCSASHDWFRRCLADEEPYRDYFVAVSPGTTVSGVTRPRSHPLLTEFATATEPRHFWTTFSTDQLDLNFANPAMLREMLSVLMLYLASGGRIIRLDAIAYLWKTIGTSCIHLPETHEVVKLMRTLVDEIAPNAILLTETNVPHAENVSYFGDGDEAHMVYQFSLAPLLLDAYINEDATYLNAWLANLQTAPKGCTYFNFTASHDGVGVRPLEGLAPNSRRDGIAERVKANGGHVSYKRNTDGSESPYELNATWFSALRLESVEHTVRRFLGSQLLQVSLQGIPGIYVHSLFGTPNWDEGVEQTGRARTINRRKLTEDEVTDWTESSSSRARIFAAMKRLLAKRSTIAALSPEATQTVHSQDSREVVVVERGDAELFAVLNTTAETQSVALPVADLTLEPFESAWLIQAGDGYERFDFDTAT